MITNKNDLEKVDDLVDLVEKLPDEERQIVLQKLEIYQGDLPHPEILEGYNNLFPETAKLIIENGVAESEHRRKMEERYLSGNIAAHKFGQVLGFIVALLIFACGTFLIFTGHSIAGSIMTGTTALGIIGLFANNSKKIS